MNKPGRVASFLDHEAVIKRSYSGLRRGLIYFSACCNHEDLSLSLRHSHKHKTKQNKTKQACNPRAGEAETDGYLEFAIETAQPVGRSGFSDRPCAKSKVRKEDSSLCPLAICTYRSRRL